MLAFKLQALGGHCLRMASSSPALMHLMFQVLVIGLNTAKLRRCRENFISYARSTALVRYRTGESDSLIHRALKERKAWKHPVCDRACGNSGTLVCESFADGLSAEPQRRK